MCRPQEHSARSVHGMSGECLDSVNLLDSSRCGMFGSLSLVHAWNQFSALACFGPSVLSMFAPARSPPGLLPIWQLGSPGKGDSRNARIFVHIIHECFERVSGQQDRVGSAADGDHGGIGINDICQSHCLPVMLGSPLSLDFGFPFGSVFGGVGRCSGGVGHVSLGFPPPARAIPLSSPFPSSTSSCFVLCCDLWVGLVDGGRTQLGSSLWDIGGSFSLPRLRTHNACMNLDINSLVLNTSILTEWFENKERNSDYLFTLNLGKKETLTEWSENVQHVACRCTWCF